MNSVLMHHKHYDTKCSYFYSSYTIGIITGIYSIVLKRQCLHYKILYDMKNHTVVKITYLQSVTVSLSHLMHAHVTVVP